MSEEEPWTNINDSEQLNFARLAWHCWVKGVQAGCVIGCAIVAPYSLYQGIRRKQSVDFRQLARRQVYSMGAFSVIALGMMMSKYVGWEDKARCVQDRAYRIHYNKAQTIVDKISYGCFLGSFIPMYLISKRIVFSLGATSPFIVGGMVYYQLNKQKLLAQQ